MIFSDYKKLTNPGSKFNFSTKTQFFIDKVLIEILADTKGGDKIYESLEAIPKILLPKELMKFYFPDSIPDSFFVGGENSFQYQDNDLSENIPMDLPRDRWDSYKQKLDNFFERLDHLMTNNNAIVLADAYAVITANKVVEDAKIFTIKDQYISDVENKNALFFSPELIDDLYKDIIDELEVKRDKELLKAFLYVESMFFLNLIQKSKKLKNSSGYLINNSFYKAFTMRECALKYSKLIYGKTISKRGDFKPFDVFKAKLKQMPREYGLFCMYLDFMFNENDDDFFDNFRKCIEKGDPLANDSGKNFLIYMDVNIHKDRSKETLWKDLATKILNYKR
jgi:hypothetical protein